MRFITSRLKTIFPGLNRREFTEDDCWRFCRKNKVLVRRAPLEVRGYTGKTTVRNCKRYYILIDEKLRGVELLKTFLHEIGHIALHEPRGNLDVLFLRRENSFETKQEIEADVFMLLALIPFYRYCELKKTPPEEFHPSLPELLLRRDKLYEIIKE
jgi:hypothetical protein